MSTAENRELVRSLFAETARGNGRVLLDALAEDARWTVTGTTRWSRTYEGKAAIVAGIFRPLVEIIDGPIKTIAERVHADGDFVIVEARGDNRTRAGKPYCNRYCFVFRVEGGKIEEVTEYLDTELVTAAL